MVIHGHQMDSGNQDKFPSSFPAPSYPAYSCNKGINSNRFLKTDNGEYSPGKYEDNSRNNSR